jgi:hypothetical protein
MWDDNIVLAMGVQLHANKEDLKEDFFVLKSLISTFSWPKAKLVK